MRRLMLLLAVFGLVSTAWAADPFVGTWKLNLEKSKFSPGPAPKSRIIKIEAQENGYKSVTDSVNAQGQSTHNEMNMRYDGKDYPLTSIVNATGVPSDVTLSQKRIDAYTHEGVLKQGGRELQTMRETVSKDGKTLTRTSKGKNIQGQEVNNVIVFDKQ